MALEKYFRQIFYALITSDQSDIIINLRDIYIGKNISLYENDYVFNLFEENLETSIYRSPSLWVVEFYRHWCGYCRRAVPYWKALAEDVKAQSCIFIPIPLYSYSWTQVQVDMPERIYELWPRTGIRL